MFHNYRASGIRVPHPIIMCTYSQSPQSLSIQIYTLTSTARIHVIIYMHTQTSTTLYYASQVVLEFVCVCVCVCVCGWVGEKIWRRFDPAGTEESINLWYKSCHSAISKNLVVQIGCLFCPSSSAPLSTEYSTKLLWGGYD